MNRRLLVVALVGLAGCGGKAKPDDTTPKAKDLPTTGPVATGDTPPAEPVAVSSDVLSALVPLGDRLEAGVNAILAGADPLTAFGDWKVEIGDDMVMSDVGALRGNTAVFAGVELDFMLGEGESAYHVRTMAHASSRAAVFIAISGRDGSTMDGVPVAQLTGQSAPLASAARAVLAAAPDCTLPLAEVSLLDQLGLRAGRMREDGLRMIEGSRVALPEVCAQLNAHRTEPMSVRIDDGGVVIVDNDGDMAAVIELELHVAPDGSLVVELQELDREP